MKKPHIWIIVLAILFSMAITVEAKDTYSYSVKNWEASADWGSIFVHVTKHEETPWPVDTIIYVSQNIPNNFYYGYAYDDVFYMDDQLDTATLSPVYIKMYNITGAFVKTIKIQVQWTGKDSLQHWKYINGIKYFARNSTATGSIDDVSMEQTDYTTLERSEGTIKYK